MPVQADAFIAEYEVLDQHTNVPNQAGGSGLSGTLLFDEASSSLDTTRAKQFARLKGKVIDALHRPSGAEGNATRQDF